MPGTTAKYEQLVKDAVNPFKSWRFTIDKHMYSAGMECYTITRRRGNGTKWVQVWLDREQNGRFECIFRAHKFSTRASHTTFTQTYSFRFNGKASDNEQKVKDEIAIAINSTMV